MKYILLILLSFSTLTLHAQESSIEAIPYKQLQNVLGKDKPYFVEFGAETCHSCQIMGKLLYKTKQNNPSFNIVFVNVNYERKAAYLYKIQMIPTQIIFDKAGEEVYRHVGILTSKELETIFKTYKF